jgi:Protein of unknown function (DUF1579)
MSMTSLFSSLLAQATLGVLLFSISGPGTQTQEDMPAWVERGVPGAGHAALSPLVGRWRTRLSVYGTMGRDPDLPPLVSDEITTTREWIADGQYLEDRTEGTLSGQPYWRRGWLGYSNMDRRYEWVTIAPRVPMMIYLGKPGAGEELPITMMGVFTDQGVLNEDTVGKPVGQKTVIKIEGNDRHVFELYFKPPEGPERLAMRMEYERI